MNVRIDLSPLLVLSAGVKAYLFHWYRAMKRAETAVRVGPYPCLPEPETLVHNRSVYGSLTTWPAILRVLAGRRMPRLFLDPAGHGVDVFHTSNLVAGGPQGCRLTATVYDLTGRLMSSHHTEATVRMDRAMEAVYARAAGLIAISEHTRQDAIRHLGLPAERIVTIYPGIAREYFDVSVGESCAVRTRYSLAKPYVLVVGTVEPRKNLDLLLDAWLALPGELRSEYELVVAGGAGWHAEKTLRRLMSGLPGVRYLGYVPEADVPGLTRGAEVLAMPSLYEGFGFPVAQAMAAGVAVLTSNVSSLPEVAGEAGVLVDPRSREEVRAGFERLLESAELRQRLGSAGRERARLFSWENAAARSLEFFEQVAGR
jgi:alpha-1,3-rhamnosyl/mannosyltransferase